MPGRPQRPRRGRRAGADRAYDELGRLDTVVNNVGGTFPRGFLDTSPRFLTEAFSFNVATAHALTRAAVPLMLKSADGRAVGRHDQLDDGPHRRPRVRRLRDRQGRARALDQTGRRGPGAAHPGQRHLRRLDHDQRAGVRGRPARDDEPDGDEDPARPGRGPRRHRRRGRSTSARRPASTSPASCLEVDGGIQQPNLDLGHAGRRCRSARPLRRASRRRSARPARTWRPG